MPQSSELSFRPPNCLTIVEGSSGSVDLPRIPAQFRVRYETGERRRCCGTGTCTAPRSSSPRPFCCERDHGTWLSPSRMSIQCCCADGNASGTPRVGTGSKGTSSPRGCRLLQPGCSPCTAQTACRPAHGPERGCRGT